MLLERQAELLEEAAQIDPVLARLGGGPRGLEVRLIEQSPIGPFLVLHLIYDVRDAMGANADQHCAGAAGAAGRGDHRRESSPAHPFQPGRPPAGTRALHHPLGGTGLW